MACDMAKMVLTGVEGMSPENLKTLMGERSETYAKICQLEQSLFRIRASWMNLTMRIQDEMAEQVRRETSSRLFGDMGPRAFGDKW